MQSADEPLDMSLKARKRPNINETIPKKKRASVISYGTNSCTGSSDDNFSSSFVLDESGNARSSTFSPEMLRRRVAPENRSLGSMINEDEERLREEMAGLETEDKPNRVVINYVGAGELDDHFRRSLYKEFYDEVDAEGVDAHFSRSLGHAKWKEIQHSANLKMEAKASTEATGKSGKETSKSKPRSRK